MVPCYSTPNTATYMVPCYSTPNTATYDALALCTPLDASSSPFFSFFFLEHPKHGLKKIFFWVFPFPYKFLYCGTQYTLYILTMSYDALTTAGRHLLSAEAFSFADDGKDAIKDFEWSAFSFFFCVFYQKASGRRGPPPFFPRTG